MTKGELLERIAKLSITPETNVVPSELATALMAVVELHKPDPDSCPCCGPVLDVCGVEYPCPTIQAIEKELQ